MNKNSKARRQEALKNANKGQNQSSFFIPKTMQGGSMSNRTQIINIGKVERKSTNAKVAAKRSKGKSDNE